MIKRCALAFLFLLFFGQIQAQEPIHEHGGKRIKILQPTTEQLLTLTQSGIDLKCGAKFASNALYLELHEEQLEQLDEAGIPYTVTIEDIISFHAERNATALPFAIQQLELEKQRVQVQQETRSVSTASTAISNVIQYEGETEIDWATPQNFTLGSMGGCLTYSEMLAQLDLMRSLYPNLISVKKDASLDENGNGTPIVTHGNNFTNGGQYDTWPGQTIYYVRISDNPDSDEANEPESFYSGMTHSREVSSMMNLIYYMWYVLENYDTDPDVKNIVDNNEMYFVPVANPDGLLWNEQRAPNGGGLQRKNLEPNSNTGDNFLRGVDLNRNYSYLWGTAFGGSSGATNNDTYRGTAPFSEPETRIVEQFVDNHEVTTALNHHATSNLLPHGYNGEIGAPASGREDDYAQFCQDLTRFNRYIYGEAPNILTVANGDMSDWMLGGPVRANSDGSTSIGSGEEILALAPENGDPGGLEANPDFSSGFWPSPDQIVSIAKRAMRMNFVNALYAGKTAQLHDMTPSNLTATSGTLDFGIEYLGMTLSDLTLTVTPVSANINSIGTLTTQTGWTKQEQREVSVSYQLGTITADDPIEYQVTLSNDTNIIYQATIVKYFTPTILFEDDPDTDGISNWNSSSDWTTTTDSFSGSTAITNDATPPYANNRNAILTLNNAIDLSSVNTAVIQFYAKWDMERNFDYAQIQASTDGGTTWNALSGKYTKPGSTLSSTRYSPVTGSGGTAKTDADRDNQPDGKPVYEGFNDGKWVLEEIEISANANIFAAGASSLQLRFLFDSDGSNNADGYTTNFDGFTFDDFRILRYDLDRSCRSGVVDVFPYVESFETGLGLWTQNIEDDGDLTLGSGETPSGNTGPNQASDQTYYYFTEATDNNIGVGSNAEVIVTSPCIDLNGGIIADFEFDYHMFGNNTGALALQVSPNTNNTWTTIFSRTGQQSANGNDWQSGSVDLSTYSDSTIQLRFVITTGGGFTSDIAIDNLRISPADTTDPEANCMNITVALGADGTVTILPEDIDDGSTDNIGIETLALDIDTFTCTEVGVNDVTLTVTDFAGNEDTCTATVTVNPYSTPPTGLNANAITGTTATLDWDMAASNDYEIRFRESGTTTWTTNNILTNTFNVTNLTPETDYEAQVRANCSTGNTPYSDSITFTTTPITYCLPTVLGFDAFDILNVTIAEINNTTGTEATGYGDYTDLEANLDAGSTGNTISISTNKTFNGNPFDVSTFVWIDFNRNGVLDDTEDIVISDIGNQNTLITTNFDVPVDAQIGATRMRVSLKFDSNNDPANSHEDPCADFNFGEYEDYTVIINTPIIDYTYDAGAWLPSDPSGVATCVDNMFVLSGSPTLSADTDIQDVTISSGATLDLAGNVLSACGNISNTGTLIGSNASLVMQGTTPQTIFGNAFELAEFTINNSTSVTLGGPVSVNELLNLDSGNLVSAGNLTLLSNTTETAMINEVTTATITGDVNVERFIPARRAFRFLSSSVTTTTSINVNWQEGVNNTGTNFPVDNLNPNPGYGVHITGSDTGANGFDATPSGNPSLFFADNGAQSFSAVNNTDTRTLTAGFPYLLLVRGDRSIDITTNGAAPSDTRLRASGSLYTGGLTVTGSNLNQNAGEFNFIGNPYQASVDMNDVVAGSVNINTNQYYVWDPTLGMRGAYVTVLLTGTGSSNGAGSAANHYIQPGQAAFVTTATTVGDNSTAVSFNESDKVVGQNTSTFFDGQSSDENDPIVNNAHIIGQLFHTDVYANGGKLQDNFVLIFSPDDSNAVTLKDAKKWFNQDENMGITNGTNTLSVERRFIPNENEEIQLYNDSYKAENYTMRLLQDGLNDVTAYFVDTFAGTSVPLENGETMVSFSVDQTNEASIASDRFKITFTENNLSTNQIDSFDFAMYPNPVSTDLITISSDVLNGSDVNITVHNLLGQKVLDKQQTFNQTTVINGFARLEAGIYFISLEANEGTVTKRLIIQ
jgi:hypothetical protein